MSLELVYFSGCPHVESVRERLRTVLAERGEPAAWVEWDTDVPDTPAHYGLHASPTVLLDGRDVERKPPIAGAGCSATGGPSIAALRAAFAIAER